ncbi:uncharacterized protein LOC108861724 [Raphanus sativus]|uniref:Uncharacterized protein LOC108861724 n=1 Tax=Raphanus sativus TaxID=3726 RepID=A0A9W3BRU9_RAPSA|nr:uncharacterized protein LOC108861724 [Raphanus sativus]
MVAFTEKLGVCDSVGLVATIWRKLKKFGVDSLPKICFPWSCLVPHYHHHDCHYHRPCVEVSGPRDKGPPVKVELRIWPTQSVLFPCGCDIDAQEKVWLVDVIGFSVGSFLYRWQLVFLLINFASGREHFVSSPCL